MGKYSYVIYDISVAVRGRPSARIPLDNVDGNGANFLALITNELEKSIDEIFEDDRTERAHRIESYTLDGRTVLVEGKVGPYGNSGTSIDLDTGDERDFTARTANMNPLRSMLAIPEEGYNALLFCERAGVTHFRNPIEKSIFKPINSDLRILIKTLAHVDPEAWARFLEDANIQKVTAVYRSKRREDIGGQRGRAQDLKIVAGGLVARRLGRRLSGLVSNLVRHESPVAYTLDEYPELRTGDQENYEQDRLEIQVGDGTDERTVVIEQNELPQFTYPLSGRVATQVLWVSWQEHARQILSDQGASMDP